MRAILTIVLQLLVDNDRSDDLRGSLRNISAEDAPVTFRSEIELLDQLKRLIDEKRKTPGIGKEEKPGGTP